MASHPPQPGERRRLPQDRRHPAAGRALHRHDHEHARDGQPAARDLRPGRQPDQRRQPHQPRRLRRGREVRHRPVPARRPPQPGRGHPRRGRAGLRAVVLHRLLPPGPHRHGFHGPGQARRDQAPLRPQRAWRPSRSTSSTTAPRPRARPARRSSRARSPRWTRCARRTPRRCWPACGTANATCSARARRQPGTDTTTRRDETRERRPHHPRHPRHRPPEERGGRAEGLHRVRLQHQDAHRPARRGRPGARPAAWCSSSSSATRARPAP